jgi:hypothetical protein
MFVSLNEGYVVELEVARKTDGNGWTTREISRVLAATDPASGMLGTEGGEQCSDVQFGDVQHSKAADV